MGDETPTEQMRTAANGEPTDAAKEASEAAKRAEEAAARAERAAGANGATPGAVYVAPAAAGAADGAPPILLMQQPQLSAPPGAKRRKDWTFWVPVTALAMLAAAGMLVGVFFIGSGSRPSDTDIAGRVQRAAAHQHGIDAVSRRHALTSQRRVLNASFTRRLSKAKKTAFNRGKDEGYSSGQSAGYSSGQSVGHSAGVTEGQALGYSQGNTDGFLQGLGAFTP